MKRLICDLFFSALFFCHSFYCLSSFYENEGGFIFHAAIILCSGFLFLCGLFFLFIFLVECSSEFNIRKTTEELDLEMCAVERKKRKKPKAWVMGFKGGQRVIYNSDKGKRQGTVMRFSLKALKSVPAGEIRIMWEDGSIGSALAENLERVVEPSNPSA